mmetsp:Transcript_10223/g.21526  ORF Transcript_10223/g.21526 Transcript_10223/m.21526 type:complete len:86 (+) Transcript_10223:227-484(+)
MLLERTQRRREKRREVMRLRGVRENMRVGDKFLLSGDCGSPVAVCLEYDAIHEILFPSRLCAYLPHHTLFCTESIENKKSDPSKL